MSSIYGDDFIDLELAPATADLSLLERVVAEQRARGIAFTTLAEEQRREPSAWLARFCELENETRRGIDPPRTVEQMAERIVFLKIEPESLFLAVDGDLYVGYTCLNTAESERDALVQGWTGVRPGYRRRGIATALKLLGIAYARERGYRRIVTSPRVANTASLRMSLKVGFRPVDETV